MMQQPAWATWRRGAGRSGGWSAGRGAARAAVFPYMARGTTPRHEVRHVSSAIRRGAASRAEVPGLGGAVPGQVAGWGQRRAPPHAGRRTHLSSPWTLGRAGLTCTPYLGSWVFFFPLGKPLVGGLSCDPMWPEKAEFRLS